VSRQTAVSQDGCLVKQSTIETKSVVRGERVVVGPRNLRILGAISATFHSGTSMDRTRTGHPARVGPASPRGGVGLIGRRCATPCPPVLLPR
jgi:hypothetical protein